MRFILGLPKPITWGDVREQILVAIEEEERRSRPPIITSLPDNGEK